MPPSTRFGELGIEEGRGHQASVPSHNRPMILRKLLLLSILGLAARYYASGYVSAALECLQLCYKSVWRWGRVVDVGKLAGVCFQVVVGGSQGSAPRS